MSTPEDRSWRSMVLDVACATCGARETKLELANRVATPTPDGKVVLAAGANAEVRFSCLGCGTTVNQGTRKVL